MPVCFTLSPARCESASCHTFPTRPRGTLRLLPHAGIHFINASLISASSQPHTCAGRWRTSYLAGSTSKFAPKFASVGSGSSQESTKRRSSAPPLGALWRETHAGRRSTSEMAPCASGEEGGRRKCSRPVPAEGRGLLPDGLWRRPATGALPSGSGWRRRRRAAARRSSSLRPCSVSLSTTPSWGPKRERYRRGGESRGGEERLGPSPQRAPRRLGSTARLRSRPAVRTHRVGASPRGAPRTKAAGAARFRSASAPGGTAAGAVSGQPVKYCGRGLSCWCCVRDDNFIHRAVTY